MNGLRKMERHYPNDTEQREVEDEEENRGKRNLTSFLIFSFGEMRFSHAMKNETP